MTSTDKKLTELAELMRELLAREVKPVAPIAPVLPIAPVAPIAPLIANGEDHANIATLVINVATIDTKVERLINDVQKINDNFANRIDALEKDKLCIKDFNVTHKDHEDRLREGERFREGLIGKISVLAGAISIGMVILARWVAKQFGI